MLLFILIMLPLFGILAIFILNRAQKNGLDEKEEKIKQNCVLYLTEGRDELKTRLVTGAFYEKKDIPSDRFIMDSYEGIKRMIEIYDNGIETLKKEINKRDKTLKITALAFTVVELFISLIIWFLFDNSSKHFQFVQEHYTVGHYDFYLGLDGLSIYFVLLTTLIGPISIISN